MCEATPTSYKIQLDLLKPPSVVCSFVTWILVCSVTVLLAFFAGPQPLHISQHSAWNCVTGQHTVFDPHICSGINFETSRFEATLEFLDRWDHWFALYATPYLASKFNSDEEIQIWLDVDVTADVPVNTFPEFQKPPTALSFNETDVNINNDKINEKTSRIRRYGQAKTIKCKKDNETCDRFSVLRPQGLGYSLYKISVGVKDITGASVSSSLGDVIFEFEYKNDNFAVFECLCRLMFFMLSGFGFLSYLLKMRELLTEYWTVEQAWLTGLFIALILYNDPFFVLVFLKPSELLLIISTIFKSTFICLLLVFWLIVFEGIIQNRSPKKRFTLKMSFATLLWISTSGFLTTKKIMEFREHMMDDKSVDYTLLAVFQVCTIFLGIIYLMWFILMFLKATRHFKMLQKRYKILYGLTIFMVTITLLQGLFVGLQNENGSATKLLAFNILINLYLCLLGFFYLPVVITTKDTADVSYETEAIMREVYGWVYYEYKFFSVNKSSEMMNNGVVIHIIRYFV
eukprot:GHVL01020604.1.p1 GENE.GHVL01020604.1~~GHVL01020604.1.p1  ORF type:complete len:515 (-),score=78.00 GHVL01020604.1:736-2280(-)